MDYKTGKVYHIQYFSVDFLFSSVSKDLFIID